MTITDLRVSHDPDLHVVVGLGPIGMALLNEIANRGHACRGVSRQRPADLVPPAEFVQGDIADPDSARAALAGASVVYHTASAPYHRWPKLLPSLMRGVIDAATATGARVVYADNLYAYGPVDGPLREDLPAQAPGPNGRVRAALADQLLAAHRAGRVRAVIGRAADYYGPRGRQSHVGERVFVPALAGKPAQFVGDPDVPHTYTYLGDFARGLVTLGTHDAALGQVWHLPSAPTLTTREFIEMVFELVGHPPKLRVLPGPLLALLAVFNPTLRAVREQAYQVRRPFVVDHSKFAAAFGAEVTPHREALASTLAWFAAAAGA